jgi:hypothetical protein
MVERSVPISSSACALCTKLAPPAEHICSRRTRILNTIGMWFASQLRTEGGNHSRLPVMDGDACVRSDAKDPGALVQYITSVDYEGMTCTQGTMLCSREAFPYDITLANARLFTISSSMQVQVCDTSASALDREGPLRFLVHPNTSRG